MTENFISLFSFTISKHQHVSLVMSAFDNPSPKHLPRAAEPNLAGGSKALLQVDPIRFLLHFTIEVIIGHVPHQQGIVGDRQEAPLHG